MKKLLTMISLLALAACTPADEQYCKSFGVAGTTEFGKCLSYYHAQEAAFGSDRMQCEFEADATYPRSLYDYGRSVPTFGGYGGLGGHRHHDEYGFGVGTAYIPPDPYQNAQVDALRMRIIQPCMQAAGWNSGSTWQAGRHTPKPRRPRTAQMMPNGGGLPWLK